MSRSRAVIILTVALASLAGLSGCAAPASDISVRTSELMESMVISTADQAAAGDTTGASGTLDALQSQLDRAVAAGDVTDARAARIQEAIDLVRADLQPASEVAPTETPASSDSVTPDSSTVIETPVTDDGADTGENGTDDTGPDGTGPDTTGPDTTGPDGGGPGGKGADDKGPGHKGADGKGNGPGK